MSSGSFFVRFALDSGPFAACRAWSGRVVGRCGPWSGRGVKPGAWCPVWCPSGWGKGLGLSPAGPGRVGVHPGRPYWRCGWRDMWRMHPVAGAAWWAWPRLHRLPSPLGPRLPRLRLPSPIPADFLLIGGLLPVRVPLPALAGSHKNTPMGSPSG